MGTKAAEYSVDKFEETIIKQIADGIYENAEKGIILDESLKIMSDHEAIRGFFESPFVKVLFKEYGENFFEMFEGILMFNAGVYEGKRQERANGLEKRQ